MRHRSRHEWILKPPSAAIVLAFLAGNTAADWTPVAADNGIYSAYADRSTIRRNNGIASMFGMYDFARGDLTPEGVAFFSTTVRREYDCRDRKVRLISFADHAEHLGSGRVVSSALRPRRWESIVENSIDEAFWKVACGEV